MKKRHSPRISTLLAGLVIMFCWLDASSQTVETADSVARFQAIPNDVAFDLLGLPGNNIQQPGTISAFLASVQPAVNLKGELSPGIAITFAPYQLLMGSKLQLYDYYNSQLVRILSNTQVSLGTAPSKNADSSQDWAIGTRIVILNSGDGRLDSNKIKLLAKASIEALDALPKPHEGQKVTPQIQKIYEEVQDLVQNVNNYIATGVSVTSNDSLSRMLDKLRNYADTLEAIDPSYHAEAEALRNQAEHFVFNSAILELRKIKPNPGWNATTLDVDAGAVYRANNAIIRQSALSRFRVWINGGIGLGDSQLLGQLGYYRQYALSGQADSTYLSYAIMYRYGNQDFRLGIGGNGIGTEKGSISIVAEIRMSPLFWIIASLNRDLNKGMTSVWSPGISLKTSGGLLGI
ncbi:MAG TPA: hypothetical protein VLX91_01810 [Candidatus Acidoferrales bacterium]|nr:hypothetical protein [Candidatus Acidoferrales bacterium]